MAQSIAKQLIDAVVDAIRDLDLTGIEPAAVQSIELPADEEKRFAGNLPIILVSVLGTESFVGGTNRQDNIGWPIVVAIEDRQSAVEASEDAWDLRLYSRELLIDHFIHNTVSITAVGLYEQDIEPLPIIDPQAWNMGVFLSAFVIRCTLRKARRV